jgi:ribosome production factor 2
MRLRRDKMAGIDLFKEACRKPKHANVDKKKEGKNKWTNELGETKGKVFVQNQDMATLKLKKFGRKNSGKDGAPTPETL